jgi:hypothetical protein
MTSMFEAWWNFRNFSFGFPTSHAPTLISSTLAEAAARNFNWTVRNAASSHDTQSLIVLPRLHRTSISFKTFHLPLPPIATYICHGNCRYIISCVIIMYPAVSSVLQDITSNYPSSKKQKYHTTGNDVSETTAFIIMGKDSLLDKIGRYILNES